MKPLICELCGSNDFIKKDGFFQCQHCGTKYTPEEAHNLMLSVSINGSLKKDTSSELQNYLLLARRSKNAGDDNQAYQYYNMVLSLNANSWEAQLYTTYYKSKQLSIGDMSWSLDSYCSGCITAIQLLQETENTDELAQSLLEILEATQKLDDYSYPKIKYMFSAGTYERDYRIAEISYMHQMIGYNVYFNIHFPNDDKVNASCVHSWKRAISLLIEAYPNNPTTKDEVAKMTSYIQRVEPDFVMPTWYVDSDKYKRLSAIINAKSPEDLVRATNSTRSGCYIATAVYGSYDCPQVWTLRRYRDNVLSKSKHGRLFIRFYYAVSPSLVQLFGNQNLVKKTWKLTLDKIVSNLNHNGISSSPYSGS